MLRYALTLRNEVVEWLVGIESPAGDARVGREQGLCVAVVGLQGGVDVGRNSSLLLHQATGHSLAGGWTEQQVVHIWGGEGEGEGVCVCDSFHDNV